MSVFPTLYESKIILNILLSNMHHLPGLVLRSNLMLPSLFKGKRYAACISALSNVV